MVFVTLRGAGVLWLLTSTTIGFLFSILLTSNAQADLAIYHFNVGMGDSTLILNTQSNRSLLIDAGNRGLGRKVVAPTLKALGITEIDYFVATHYDSDHIGGFDELPRHGIIIKKVYDRGDFTNRKEKSTRTNRLTQYGEYLEAANAANRESIEPSCTPVIKLGPDVIVETVAVKGKHLLPDCGIVDEGIKDSHDNDLSIAHVIRHKQFSYFIGGDLTGGGNGTKPMESKIAHRVGDVDILKLNHHGSATSSSKEFLTVLSPEVAVISVGNGGVNLRYGLPRQDVLNRLGALKPPPLVFLTNKGEGGLYPGQFVEDRHIVIHTNGASYTVNGIILPVDELRRPVN